MTAARHARDGQYRDDSAAWLADTWVLIRSAWLLLTILISRRVHPRAAGGAPASTPEGGAPGVPAVDGAPVRPAGTPAELPDADPGEVTAPATPGAAPATPIPDCARCDHLWASHGPGGDFCEKPDCECEHYMRPAARPDRPTSPRFTPRAGFPAVAPTIASPAVPDDIPEDWPPGPLVRLYADPYWLLLDTRRIRARDLAARVSTADGYGSAIWRLRARTGAAA